MTSMMLPTASSVLALCAHPDDESFGLGAVLAAFVDQSTRTAALCFTRGEASTLHATEGDLAAVRSQEFEQAAAVLGVSRSELLDYPDGHLADQSLSELIAHVVRMTQEVGADLLLTFDEGGITGHLDHEQATRAAVATGTSCGVPMLAWATAEEVAFVLNNEFGSGFLGRREDQLDFRVSNDRALQSEAIACHVSQSASNPVLRRRLELSDGVEPLRWLTPAKSPLRTTS